MALTNLLGHNVSNGFCANSNLNWAVNFFVALPKQDLSEQ